jgi:hypothetical protein
MDHRPAHAAQRVLIAHGERTLSQNTCDAAHLLGFQRLAISGQPSASISHFVVRISYLAIQLRISDCGLRIFRIAARCLLLAARCSTRHALCALLFLPTARCHLPAFHSLGVLGGSTVKIPGLIHRRDAEGAEFG